MPRHTWLAFSLWVALADCLGPAWTGTQVDLTVLNWDRLRGMFFGDYIATVN